MEGRVEVSEHGGDIGKYHGPGKLRAGDKETR